MNICTSQHCGLSIHSVHAWWALCHCMTSRRTVSVQLTVCLPQTRGAFGEENMFVVVLSVSFCLSDGCEGQSLLAVSQNGLSLSLASLFSGICRLGAAQQ